MNPDELEVKIGFIVPELVLEELLIINPDELEVKIGFVVPELVLDELLIKKVPEDVEIIPLELELFNNPRPSCGGVENKLLSILVPGEKLSMAFNNLLCAINVLKLKSGRRFNETPCKFVLSKMI